MVAIEPGAGVASADMAAGRYTELAYSFYKRNNKWQKETEDYVSFSVQYIAVLSPPN